jgi:antitoxin FitA
MAQLVVQNLKENVKARLRQRAARNGRSMEEEAREILHDVLTQEDDPPVGLGTRLAGAFPARAKGWTSTLRKSAASSSSRRSSKNDRAYFRLAMTAAG